MRLVSFVHEGLAQVGAMVDGAVVNLTQAMPGHPGDMLALLALGDEGQRLARQACDEARERLPLAGLRLLAPVPRPGKFLGVGGNFESHLREVAHMGMKKPVHQIWFNKQTTCVTGPFDPIYLPRVSDQLDYEGELGIVIGKRCRYVSVEEALSMVAGYVVCNDVSVRDFQLRAPTATLGKSFDTHGPFGPCLVTPDDVGDPGDLRIRTWVNGELRQDGSTDEMVFNCAQLISELSQACTLEPGDILSTGSPAGCGGLRTPVCYLKVGDVVRVEIDRVGFIENTVVREPDDLVYSARPPRH